MKKKRKKTPAARLTRKEVMAKAISTFGTVITNPLPLDDDHIDEVVTESRAALDRLLTASTPTIEDVDCLKISFELAIHLCSTNSNGDQYVGGLEDALLCLKACKLRKVTHGRFGFHGDELGIVREALNMHDALVNIATKGEIRAAADFLKRFEYVPTVGQERAA